MNLEFTLDAPGGLISQVKTLTAVTTPPSRVLPYLKTQTVITGAHDRAATIAALVTSLSSTKADTYRPSGAWTAHRRSQPRSPRPKRPASPSSAATAPHCARCRRPTRLLRPAGRSAGAHPGGRRRGAHPAGGHRPWRAGGKRRNGAWARRRMRRSRAYCSRSLALPSQVPDRVLVTKRRRHPASEDRLWFGLRPRSRSRGSVAVHPARPGPAWSAQTPKQVLYVGYRRRCGDR